MKLFKKITITTAAAISLAGLGANGFAAANTTFVQAAPKASIQKQISDLNKKVAKLNSQVSAKQLEIDGINAKNDELKEEIAETQKEIKAAKKELSERKEVLKEQLVELQKQSNNTVSGNIYIDYVLNSGNFSDFIGRAMAVNKISSANQAAIEDVEEAKAKLDDLAGKQEEKREKIAANKKKAESEMANLNAAKETAEASQQKLQEEMWANQEEMEYQNKINAQATQRLTSTNTTTRSFAGSSSLIQNASQFIGVPYVWGGSTPSGFDCSGLTQYAANMAGISLPRTSQAQSTVGTYVPVSDLQAGDLVFWGGVGSAYHVGVYIGGGQFIHAPQPGENVKVGSSAYFAPSFGRRL